MKSPNTLVAFGDSLTYGYPFSPSESWVEDLRRATGWKVINSGIPGDTWWDMLQRMERDVLGYKPDTVLAMAGTNDVYIGLSQSRIQESFTALMEALFREKVRVWLGIPLPVDDDCEGALSLWRNWMRQYAGEKGLLVVDFYRDFLDAAGNIRGELFLDGCHPSKKGYELMGKRILATLKETGFVF